MKSHMISMHILYFITAIFSCIEQGVFRIERIINSRRNGIKTFGESLHFFLYFVIYFLVFINSDAILNFEHIAMHCGLSRVTAINKVYGGES